MALDGPFFPATYLWDTPRDAAVRGMARSNYHPERPDEYRRQRTLIETDQLAGMEAYDFQNPYVWQSRSLLTTATLDPAYGITGSTPQAVLQNIIRSQGVLEK